MQNLIRLRKWMYENSYDSVIMGRRDNYKWLTNGMNDNAVLTSTEVGVAYFIITKTNIFLLADESDARRVFDEQNILNAKSVSVPWEKGTAKYLADYCKDKRAASDTDISGAVNTQNDFVSLRMTLTEEEQEKYREIGKECAWIIEQCAREAKPGDTEIDIANKVKKCCIDKGISPDCVIVGSDERLLKYRHPTATNKKVERMLMIVLGGEKYGLNISLTRMISFEALSKEQEEKMDKTARIFAEMQTTMSIKPSNAEFFNVIKNGYAKEGYPNEWKRHHQGGPTGYACREIVFAPEMEGKIEANRAYAWNPTLQGMKCEDTTLLKNEKIENLTDTGEWPRIIIKTKYGEFASAKILIKRY